MKYSLKGISPTVSEIKLGRDKIGTVTQYGSRYTAVVRAKDGRRVEKTDTTPRRAFQQIVAALNRIDICGEDDAGKAFAALRRRNEEQAAFAREVNQMIGLNVVTLRRRRVRI
jgi:hypothetical protein